MRLWRSREPHWFTADPAAIHAWAAPADQLQQTSSSSTHSSGVGRCTTNLLVLQSQPKPTKEAQKQKYKAA